MIQHLLRLTQHSGTLALKKLCSALVVFFLRFPSIWRLCIRHLVTCFSHGVVVPLESIDQSPEISEFPVWLGADEIIIILWFSTTLIDEVGKVDPSNIKE